MKRNLVKLRHLDDMVYHNMSLIIMGCLYLAKWFILHECLDRSMQM